MIGGNKIRLEQTDSTNMYLLRLMETERPEEGTVISAGYQTAGRGAESNAWESEAGKNLTFSFVLYPDFLAAEAQFTLNKFISLGITDYLRNIVDKPVSIKWPNDIYIGNKKIAGILIQNGIQGNRFQFAVIGIGLNVNQDVFAGDAPNPVSIRMITGRSHDLDLVLDVLCGTIDKRYRQLINGEIPAIDRDYLGLLYRYGEKALYEINGKKVEARITGVSKYGRLQLEVPSQRIIECDMKEVVFI